MKRAILIFILTIIGIVSTHIITSLTDFHIDYSISKYVGMSSVSSIVFLIANSLVAYFIWNEVGQKLNNKIQRALIILIIISLIGLSICPLGFYDYVIPEPVIFGRTPISLFHVVFARAMFALMAIFAGYTFYLNDIKKKYKKISTKFSLGFVMYAVFCIVCCVFFPDFFWGLNIILESTYLLGFFVVLLTI